MLIRVLVFGELNGMDSKKRRHDVNLYAGKFEVEDDCVDDGGYGQAP